jgi:hypothetical protein
MYTFIIAAIVPLTTWATCVSLSPAQILFIYRELIPGIRDVDWHRFYADPDSDQTFNINADPDPGLTPS